MNKSEQHTIFITGACGFAGQYLVELLSKTTNSKLILNCRDQNNRKGQLPNITFTKADLGDVDSLEKILVTYQPNVIIHLAGITRIKDGEQNPEEAYRINYLGTKAFLDLAIKHQVAKFVFVSSDLARNHQSVVGITKYLVESHIQTINQSHSEVITVRLPNIAWTPGSVHTIFDNQIKSERTITITDPDMSRRFISGEESAEYILEGLKHGKHKGIFIVNKLPIKITDLAQEMINESGKNINIDFIGKRAGEKLEEETYHSNDLVAVSFKDLSLLNNLSYGSKGTKNAIKMLNQKPGFSADIEEN